MHALIEEILKLSRDEKIEILHWLQENVANCDNMPKKEGLSEEILAELKGRELLDETGEVKWIAKEELFDFLKQTRNAT